MTLVVVVGVGVVVVVCVILAVPLWGSRLGVLGAQSVREGSVIWVVRAPRGVMWRDLVRFRAAAMQQLKSMRRCLPAMLCRGIFIFKSLFQCFDREDGMEGHKGTKFRLQVDNYRY